MSSALLRSLLRDRAHLASAPKRIQKPFRSPMHPWQPIDDDGEGNVSFHPALFNNVMPNIGGAALNADPVPTLAISVSGTVYLKVSRDGTTGQPTSDTLVLENAASTPANTSDFLYLTIHYVSCEAVGEKVNLEWAIGRTTSLDCWVCSGHMRVQRA